MKKNSKIFFKTISINSATYKILIIVLALLFFVSTSKAQDYSLRFSYLTVENGLSHTDAKDICQDKLGYIWIATLFGINRYDGYSIKKFYNNNDIKNNAFKNRVRCIFADENNQIWLATDGGIQRFNSKTEKYIDYKSSLGIVGDKVFTKIIKLNNNMLAAIINTKFYLFKIENNSLITVKTALPSNVSFTNLFYNKNGSLLISSEKGLWLLDKTGNNHQFMFEDKFGNQQNNISNVIVDKENNLLLIVGDGIFILKDGLRIIERQTSFSSSKLPINNGAKLPQAGYITDCVQDNRHEYWVSTEKGLYNFTSSFKLKKKIDNTSFISSLNINYLDKLFIDRTDCLWACTYGGGVNYCDLNAKAFYTIQNNPKIPNTLSGNFIRVILEENKEEVWIGTNESGLNSYNFKTKSFKVYNSTSGRVRLKCDLINALTFDNLGNLWVGTDRGLDIINKNRESLINLRSNVEFPSSVTSLTRDKFGNIWFCTNANLFGCISFDLNSQNYKVQYKGQGRFIWTDKDKGELLIGGTEGVTRLQINQSGHILRRFNYTSQGNISPLSSNYTLSIKKQNDSTYWIGTLGGGLNRLIIHQDQTYVIKSFGKEYGIFNDVESIEIDNSGNIWMGGNGLYNFNPKTYSLVKYDKNDGLQGNSFKYGASTKGWDGKLYFGGINGLNYFYPDSIKKNLISARPVITDLFINNKSVYTGQSDSISTEVHQTVSFDKEITLNYLQNNFVISFSGMHFANPLKCKYRYRLIGFDTDWKYTDGAQPNASYNNLDFKSYTFIIDATNNDGFWSKSTASLIITINPPWWKSTTAKIIYLLLIFSGLSGIYIYQARWYRLKREIDIRNVEERKREEMHLQKEDLYQQQLHFFTNISHEFRTPLTLIIGPLEKLLKQNLYLEIDHFHEVMYRNAKRLNNLINEIMNFRKVAESVIKLKVAEINVHDFSKDIFKEFEVYAINNNINYKYNITDNKNSSWLDKQIGEKILSNLLINAFKYTKKGGCINLDVYFHPLVLKSKYESEYRYIHPNRANNYVYFKISDSGIGISKESIAQIFDRFYKVGNHHLGSGIGLALVKSLTILHKGDIFVYSEYRKGTEIIIALPSDFNSYEDSEVVVDEANDLQIELEPVEHLLDEGILTSSIKAESANPTKIKEQILLVEDNFELRSFLKSCLHHKYHILEAEDGKQGYELAIAKLPDLIISDVMMPSMNGVELCFAIKQQFETSHIPFLILSAKDALASKLEGLESGADFYFSKPLNIDLLLLTIHNVFEQREKLKLRFTRDYYAEATELVRSAKDKEFLEKLLKLIDNNISAPELDVDYLCSNLFTSRSKLYQKIKHISGLAIGDFIRTARLKKAVYLMTHEDITINELIVKVGFTSTSYFSKAFRKEFGHSPSQFLKSFKNSADNTLV